MALSDDDVIPLKKGDCVFCDIIDGLSPAKFVSRLLDAVSFIPLNPVVKGHVLFVPKRHIIDAADSPDTAARLMRHASEYASKYENFNIITSKGKAATQSIMHLHLHVIPRTEDDDLMVPWGTVYGENPSAPHWCRTAQDLQDRIDRLEDGWRYESVEAESVEAYP